MVGIASTARTPPCTTRPYLLCVGLSGDSECHTSRYYNVVPRRRPLPLTHAGVSVLR